MSALTAPTEIVLDLTDDFRDANAFIDQARGTNLGKLIQQEALKRFQGLIIKIIGNIEKDSEAGQLSNRGSAYLLRRHETITIHGQRGSGKTTFILNVMHALEHNAEFCAELGLRPGDLVSLGLVDPTLIETKEHVIVTLATIIKKKVEEAYNRSKVSIDEKRYESWTLALEDLAEGMCLLDGIGGKDVFGEDWQDPHYVMHRGLERAASGTHFERKFHGFVSESLKFLNARAFILAFDDIDTSFVRGWEVLEIIRKYLTTSKLITILSGDMGLYSLLVRGNQWKNLSEHLLKSEQWVFEKAGQKTESQADGDVPMLSRMPEIIRIIDQLEAQYLLKVVKPENRIDLDPLLYYTKKGGGYDLKVRDTQDAPERRILDVLKDMAEKALGFRTTSDQDFFQTVLLRQPTRTVVQVLQGMRSPSPEAGPNITEIRKSLQRALQSPLYSRSFDPDALRDADPSSLIMIFIKWLTETRNWELAYRLRPEHRDDALNLAVVAISSAMLTAFEQKPGVMLEYMLKVARPQLYLTRSLGGKDEYRNYISFTGLAATESVLQSTRKMIAWERTVPQMTRRLNDGVAAVLARDIRGVKSSEDYNVALLSLYGLGYTGHSTNKNATFKWEDGDKIKQDLSNLRGGAGSEILRYFKEVLDAKQKGEITNKQLRYRHLAFNTIDSLTKNLHGVGQLVVALPTSFVLDKEGSTNGFYSIYPLIALVSLLLSMNEGVALDDLKGDVTALLKQAAAPRTYPAPSIGFSVQEAADTDDGVGEVEPIDTDTDDTDEEQGSESDQISNLADALAVWVQQSRKGDLAISPVTLARIMTRYLYTSQSIADELRVLETRYLGTFMHRQIIAFLNAVLLESLLAAGKQQGVDLGNPVKRALPFIKNLRVAGYPMSADVGFEAPAHLAFFDVLFSCPLWGFFLDPQGQDKPVFELQLKTWARYALGVNANDLVSAGFSPGRKENADPNIKFDNLYDPLNSVYIQGGKSVPLKLGRGSRRQRNRGAADSAPDGDGVPS